MCEIVRKRAKTVSNRIAIAAHWLLKIQSDDVQPEEFDSWLAWYEADPLNRAAFEDVQRAFDDTRNLPPADRTRIAHNLMARPPRFRWLRWFSPLPFVAGAGAVVIVAVSVWLMSPPQQSEITAAYQTPLATHKVQRLPDGSELRLGARSSVSLNFSAKDRYVVLESGEALFKVAKDVSRPFVVQAGSITVRAVGTQFNVRRAGDSTTVAVSEGVVEIEREQAPGTEVRLEVGHLAAVSNANEEPTVKTINVAAVSAWQNGRLEFFNEPLPQVVATVNRYSSREIVVTDPALANLRITGSIDGRNISEWLRALPEIFPVKVDEISKTTVLISPS